MKSMKQPLESVTNLVTIAACIAIVVHITLAQYQRYQNRPLPPYQAGDIIADTEHLNLNQADLTVLIGTASTCPYCLQSMPFYARLEHIAAEHGVRVVAYTTEDVERNREFFAQNGVNVHSVVLANENAITLRATPSLVLVRGDGTVIDSWRGHVTR